MKASLGGVRNTKNPFSFCKSLIAERKAVRSQRTTHTCRQEVRASPLLYRPSGLAACPASVRPQAGLRFSRSNTGSSFTAFRLDSLWTYALSSEINQSLYHPCCIWSHNHYPTAEKEMKPLIAQGVELSVQSRKVFIKFSFEKWFFMTGHTGRATIRKQYSYCRLLSPLGCSQYMSDCRPSTAFKLSTDYIPRLACNINT